jgi:hypothetical protein
MDVAKRNMVMPTWQEFGDEVEAYAWLVRVVRCRVENDHHILHLCTPDFKVIHGVGWFAGKWRGQGSEYKVPIKPPSRFSDLFHFCPYLLLGPL